MIWLYFSAIAMIATAIIHSMAGEKRLIGPLLQGTSEPLDDAQARKVLRSAWHLTSGFMILCAAMIAWPGTPVGLLRVVGGFWLILGLFSLITSKGKHVGWPTLVASGAFALIGVAS